MADAHDEWRHDWQGRLRYRCGPSTSVTGRAAMRACERPWLTPEQQLVRAVFVQDWSVAGWLSQWCSNGTVYGHFHTKV